VGGPEDGRVREGKFRHLYLFALLSSAKRINFYLGTSKGKLHQAARDFF